MGLGFSESKASWSYTGFMDFRERLAAEIGIDLQKMVGFSNRKYHSPDHILGTMPWDKITDPIKPFLNHSDCEGELSPEDCLIVAPRLRELVADWDEFDYDRQNALILADDMERCGKDGKALIFC